MEQAREIERRRHPRFEVMAQIRVKRGRNAYVADVVNISESGALVDLGTLEQPFWLASGRKVEVILFVPEDDVDFSPMSVWADIVRVFETPAGLRFAVQFDDASGDVASAVRRFVEASVPRPPPLPLRR